MVHQELHHFEMALWNEGGRGGRERRERREGEEGGGEQDEVGRRNECKSRAVRYMYCI